MNEEPRFAFVEMLFALAIAEVAISSAHLVAIESNWTSKLPATSHLLLAALLIATSWLGWSGSKWRKAGRTSDSPFTWDFIGLSIDVLLVVIYFILVRQADISEDPPFHLRPASAVPEAKLILLVFFVYIVWDIASDVIKEPEKLGFAQRFGLGIACTLCSVICMGLAAGFWWRANYVSSPFDVMMLDLSLACVVLLFRAIKYSIEKGLRLRYPSLQGHRALVERPSRHRETEWSWGILVIYFVAQGS